MQIDPSKHYYVEPVEIEVYLKKAGKVRTIIRDLFVELIDVDPINEKSADIFNYFRGLDRPVDLMELQDNFPELIKHVYESYYQNMELFERLSMHFKSGLETDSTDSWRQSIYLTELLLKYEPTIASTKYIGEFQTYNLNYLIIKLNSLKENFLLEDSTVSYLIRRRNSFYADNPPDREFDKLVELWTFNVRNKGL
jgi:hypothetical protein